MAEELQLESQSSSIGPQKVDLAAMPLEPAAPATNSQPPRHPSPSGQSQNYDQLAVGHHIIQIGSVHGGIVQIAAPEQQPQISLRATPVFVLPRPFAGLLGRQTEIATAIATLQTKAPVELYSGSGFGKSVLLRHLAYDPQVTLPFPHGTVHLEPNSSQPVSDVLQALFESFCQSDIPFKPTDMQIRQALQHQQALILLDDQHLQRREVETLMNAVPGCTFFLASPERRLEEGRSLLLPGLPLPEALMLIERELGRALTDAEKPSAQALWNLLEGNPRHLLYAAGQVRNQPIALAELVRQMRSTSPLQALIQNILTALSERQRWVLAGLAALGGIGLLANQAAALTDLPDAETILESLQQARLTQVEGSRYSLSQTLTTSVQQTWDLTAWRERALHYFSAWAEQHQAEPSQLLENIDAIAQVLQFAVSTEQWTVTLQLVRTIEGTLALSKQWGLWARVLDWGLLAARSLGDSMAEAWALHQLGTRALCLEDIAIARELLTQALQLREALGDEPGAAVTRHNLSLLPPVPLPLDRQRDRFSWPAFAIVSGLLIVGLLGLFIGLDQRRESLKVLDSRGERQIPIPDIVLPTSPTPQPNQAPIAQVDAVTTAFEQVVRINVLANDRDPDGDALTFSLAARPKHGLARVEDGAIAYQPKAGFSGTDQFTYKLQDGRGGVASVTVTITVKAPNAPKTPPLNSSKPPVTPANQAPVANADTAKTEFATPVTITVLENDSDPEGDRLTAAIKSAPPNGVADVNADSTVTYQPKAGFAGSDAFTYQVSDRQGNNATATVTVTVAPAPNQDPRAVDDQAAIAFFAGKEPRLVTIPVLDNDSDPGDDSLQIASTTNGKLGLVVVNDDQTITYSLSNQFAQQVDTVVSSVNQPPLQEWMRALNTQSRLQPIPSQLSQVTEVTDSFTYTITDGRGGTATATVTVTIDSKPPEPKTQPDPETNTGSG